MAKLEYIDYRNLTFYNLEKYPSGIGLPRKNGDNIIEVTDEEKKALFKHKNGRNQVFKEVNEKKKNENKIVNSSNSINNQE